MRTAGTDRKIIVVGGGPAGMMAAIAAAQKGALVTLLEKNDTLGKKLLLTGKGRCNITTSCEKREIIEAFSETGNGRFLWDSLNQFDNQALRQFFEDRGLKLKEERGRRFFPVTDSSQSVLDLLQKELGSLGVVVRQRTAVHKITRQSKFYTRRHSESRWVGTKNPSSEVTRSHEILRSDVTSDLRMTGGGKNLFTLHTSGGKLTTSRLILATGGKSYPQTGSTGNGFGFAQKLGHRIIPLRGALVPLESPEKKIHKLQGLGLKNVVLALWCGDELLTYQFGEMLFTHFGISGPIVLEASRFVDFGLVGRITAQIDFKPALDIEKLDQRLLREVAKSLYLSYQGLLKLLLPKKIIPLAVAETGISATKKISQLSRRERHRLIRFLKNFRFEISGPQRIEKAIITAGGVDLAEIEPKTMESKVCPGLFMAGELLDLDGPSGGFNLQMCFTTGYVAGLSASEKCV